MIKKTIVIAGQQGERGDKAEEYSVPIDGVLGFTETGTPDGYVEAGYFKVTGLDEVDSRIDVIESLPEGSTSGDAEVADIRVGVDGEIYDSAGIAVRDQITELHDYAESIDDVQDAQIETLKVTKAVEGEYITLNDAASLPAESYSLTLFPVQDLNGYEYPWAAGAGKNKWGYGDVSGTTIKDISVNIPPGTYTLSAYVESDDTDSNVCMLYSLTPSHNGTLGYIERSTATRKSVTFTIDYTLTTIRFYASDSYGNSEGDAFSLTSIQIEQGSTATSFAPYSNICPIHGADEVGVRVCGKNLFDASVPISSISVYSVTGNSMTAQGRFFYFPSGTYTFFFNAQNTWSAYIYGNIINADGSWDSTFKLTQPDPTVCTVTIANGQYLSLYIASGSISAWENGNIQLEVGATATDYEPYVLHSTTITLPSTVYGGSVDMGGSGVSEIGFAKDEIITRIAEGTDGNADWLNVWLYTSLSLLPPSTAENREILAAKSKSNYSGFWEYQNVNGHIHFYTNRESVICAFYPKSVFPTLADFTTYYASNKAEFAIPLATPTDISVTPFPQTLLEGVNNVWAECSEDGEVIGNAQQDLTYQRDTTLAIQNLINRIEELERRN